MATTKKRKAQSSARRETPKQGGGRAGTAFRARLRKLVEAEGSAYAFAKRLKAGSASSTNYAPRVSEWLKGKVLPGFESLIAISREFDVSIDWLVGSPVPRGVTERTRIGSIADALSTELDDAIANDEHGASFSAPGPSTPGERLSQVKELFAANERRRQQFYWAERLRALAAAVRSFAGEDDALTPKMAGILLTNADRIEERARVVEASTRQASQIRHAFVVVGRSDESADLRVTSDVAVPGGEGFVARWASRDVAFWIDGQTGKIVSQTKGRFLIQHAYAPDVARPEDRGGYPRSG